MGYSRVQKRYRCHCPTLQHYFVSIVVTFFKTTPFSLPSTVTSMGENDDLLVNYVTLRVPTPSLIPVKPLITQVYSRRQNPPISSLTPATSTLDLVSSDNLPIVLRKGKRQCVHPISSFCSYNHLSSHSYSFTASLDSLFLTLSVRLYLTLVGVVLW